MKAYNPKHKQTFLDRPVTKRDGLIAGLAMAGVITLTAVLGTPDQDPVERNRMKAERGIVVQEAYQDSVARADSIDYIGK
jgi:hypothetical protein|tara:strand:+ start:321 stop:560 length:240 start_codon:yes stop_codon:yes gene_type:complete